MTDPESRLPALYADLERIAAEAEQVTTSAGLVHAGTANAAESRAKMIAVHEDAVLRSRELAEAAARTRKEIEDETQRMKREMQARMEGALAALAPLQAQMERMKEGIWTVNLYLGTDEEIVTLRTGAPAPIDAPIHLRQQTLAMDEEVAAFPTVQGMDYRDLGLFDQWITDPEHLAQVLPEERGVVVLTPRATTYDYGDPLLNIVANEWNFASYWLIRNGENLYRMSTDFKVGAHLMPTSAEFTALFERREFGSNKRVPIEPGTDEWEKAEKAQDAKRRHYMRVALILQGLIDRTDMFDPLPGNVSVMQQSAYDDGLVVILSDERALHTSREPYYQWIRRLNKDLRPGMRIIGTYSGNEWAETEFGDRWTADGNARLSPTNAERPPRDTLLTIEARRRVHGENGLVVRYPRTRKVYDPKMWVESETRPGWGHYGGERIPERRASAVVLPNDITIIPFDLVTEAEIEAYLTARTERHAYADSFPLMQAALAAKRAEREAEAPFRDLLLRILTADHPEREVTLDVVDGLVHRWKVGNKWHKPLVGEQEAEAKAVQQIRTEWQRIVDSGATEERDAAAVKVILDHDPATMFVGRLSSGKYVGFAPQPSTYPRTTPYVREHTTSKTAASVKTREWILPGARAGRMVTVHETEQWTGWRTGAIAADHLTDDEVAVVLDAARADAAKRHPHGVFLAARLDRNKVYERPNRVEVYLDLTPDIDPEPSTWRAADPRPQGQWVRAESSWSRTTDGVQHHPSDRYRDTEDRYQRPWFGDKGNTREQADGVALPWGSKAVPLIFDEDAYAGALARYAKVRARNEWDDVRRGWINEVHRHLEAQQVAEKIAAAKAEFWIKYPSEILWEEHQAKQKTRPRPDISLWGHGAAPLPGQPLERLIDTGVVDGWHEITVGQAYQMADVEFPEKYRPLAKMTLLPEPVEQPDQDEDDNDE